MSQLTGVGIRDLSAGAAKTQALIPKTLSRPVPTGRNWGFSQYSIQRIDFNIKNFVFFLKYATAFVSIKKGYITSIITKFFFIVTYMYTCIYIFYGQTKQGIAPTKQGIVPVGCPSPCNRTGRARMLRPCRC